MQTTIPPESSVLPGDRSEKVDAREIGQDERRLTPFVPLRERGERGEREHHGRQDTHQDGQTKSHHRAGCLNHPPREVQSAKGWFPERSA